MFYLFENKHTIETETELIVIKKRLHKNIQLVYQMVSEIFYGFSMAVATFYILPLSIELTGVFPSFFGVLSGVFIFLFFKRFLWNYRLIRGLLCIGIIICYNAFKMPFDDCCINGLYLGMLSGILLSVQIQKLSSETGEKNSFKKEGIWYLFGLVLGILLK